MAALLGALAVAVRAGAQAPLAGGLPGRWVEANVMRQAVTNDFGDWSAAYARMVLPGARDTWYAEALALEAFRERGVQVGGAHRHDWSDRWFHVLGANVGSGAAILPRGRVDGLIGRRWGEQRRWQTTTGLSYVKSVTELYDIAGTGSIAWYAPGAVLLETGVRYNVSRPGDIRSHRLFGVGIWTPTPTRTFSVRAIGGTEGWQVVRTGTTLTRFSSQEYSLAWREKVVGPWALSVQGDHYDNPFYTRSGVTVGVARYW